MKKKIYQIIPACLATLALTAGFSYTGPDRYNKNLDSNNEKQIETQLPTGCNAPARINIVESYDFFINVDFLYWKAIEEGTNMGSVYTTDSTETSTSDVKIDSKYHPAFRVGLGMGLSEDNWTAGIEYTRYHSTNDNSKNLDLTDLSSENRLLSSWVLSSTESDDLIFGLKSSWKVKNDLIDLNFGRPYYVGQKLIFKPIFGLRSGWMDQKYDQTQTFYDETTTEENYSTVNAKSNSWLIGPRAGIGTNWVLGKGFNVFGNAAAALFYQNFKNNFKYKNFETDSTLNTHEKLSSITPNLECALGLSWGDYFFKKQSHLNFSIGYEFHWFANQNQMNSLAYKAMSSGVMNLKKEDLMLHGITMSARFDF